MSCIYDMCSMNSYLQFCFFCLCFFVCCFIFFLFFFFFQAEDGIRDIGVTGVQTCALPISLAVAMQWPSNRPCSRQQQVREPRAIRVLSVTFLRIRSITPEPSFSRREIGRASCRERV